MDRSLGLRTSPASTSTAYCPHDPVLYQNSAHLSDPRHSAIAGSKGPRIW